MFTFSKVIVLLVLIVLAQKVTQAQPPIVPPDPTGTNTKYILADTRNFKFVPSTVNIHKSDFISFVADYSDNSWESFGFFVSKNEESCEKEDKGSSMCNWNNYRQSTTFTQNYLDIYFIHLVITRRGSGGSGFETMGSYSGVLKPGSFYYFVGIVNSITKCEMNLTSIVVSDSEPTTNAPYPKNTTNTTDTANKTSDSSNNNIRYNWIQLMIVAIFVGRIWYSLNNRFEFWNIYVLATYINIF
jgi:hypothetical protein